MKHKTIFILILLISNLTLYNQEILFPGLQGDALITELKKYYNPKAILPHTEARTKLYTDIFTINDSIECYYSGYKIPVPRNVAILPWTARHGIQVEHLYPRSMGASGARPLSDLHHLVPVRASINSLRSNSPFREIPDSETLYWLYKNNVARTPISNIIDRYSESKKGSFEPRESVKGDIARSLFYFFTLYQDAAIKRNRTYFSSMLQDLCLWHRTDPVDSTEYKKTMAIAKIQSNINPFIIDPSLAERCYCAAYPNIPIKTYSVNIYPNPSKGLFYIDIPNYKGPVIMKISDASGKLFETHHLMYSGLMSWRLGKGVYEIKFYIYNDRIAAVMVMVL